MNRWELPRRFVMSIERKHSFKLALILCVVALVLTSCKQTTVATAPPTPDTSSASPAPTPDTSASSSPAPTPDTSSASSSPAPTPAASSPAPTPVAFRPTPIRILPVQYPAIVGVGLDKNLWTRDRLDSPWVQVPNSCCVTRVTLIAGGGVPRSVLDNTLC